MDETYLNSIFIDINNDRGTEIMDNEELLKSMLKNKEECDWSKYNKMSRTFIVLCIRNEILKICVDSTIQSFISYIDKGLLLPSLFDDTKKTLINEISRFESD